EMAKFGRTRALKMYAAWTDAIAAGQTPKVKPERPSGPERNIVVTETEWRDGLFLHDQTSSDYRNPIVNPGGPVYGVGTFENTLEALNPKTLQETSISVPGLDGTEGPKAGVGVHASEMDSKGRVWIATVAFTGEEPTWCYDGSIPSSKYFP